MVPFSALVVCPTKLGIRKTNFRRLLHTVEALADLGPTLTAEREFSQSASAMLSALLQAGGTREAVLFIFSDKPSLLSSVAVDGFALMPEPDPEAAVFSFGCPVALSRQWVAGETEEEPELVPDEPDGA